MFKVSNRNARTMYEICSDLIIKTPKRHHWRRSGVFILNFEQVNVSLVCEARDILLRTKWRKKLAYEKNFSENVFFPMFPIFTKRNNFTVFFFHKWISSTLYRSSHQRCSIKKISKTHRKTSVPECLFS